MTSPTDLQSIVVRTGRGLVIAGTRITLYSIMDYVKAGWPAHLIRDRLNLDDEQIVEAMRYIHSHQEEVEAEYALVLRQAEENRQYWQERNRERFAQLAKRGPAPGKEALWGKIQEKKKQLGHS